jgi:DeoR/GlpR family transcriptional regulator of sugar metabolism
MDGQARLRRIVETLQERDQVQVGTLAEALGCSEMTVRRDLQALESSGALRRVHGGAVRGFLGADEVPYDIRALEAADAKEAIGAATAALLADGETVVLDSGTTALHVARALRPRRMTVMPLALRPIFELQEGPEIRLLVPGGEVRPTELSFVGDLTSNAFAELRFDTYVMSLCGFDVTAGVTAHHLAEAVVKRAAASASRRVIAVADSSKIGRVAFGHICDVGVVDILITDGEADEQAVADLGRAGVDVRRA